MAATQERMEGALARCLPPSSQVPARLHDAMRYAVLGGGKRVRPLLVFAAGELVDARAPALEPPACAVELVHAYSLVHDDLPCMDDDVLRRGKPTVHVEFDYATALLAGDALQTQAFEVLAGSAELGETQRLQMVATLARAAGSRGMCGGQQIDLDAVGQVLSEPELEMMHIHKTGALIRAAVHMGTLAGTPLSAADAGRVDHFAKQAGLLFQVVDDILDATTDTATLGKTAGKDQAADKPTYVSILGLAAARTKARDLLEAALEALSVFGARAARLSALAQFIARRSF
ncbi:MAG: polyprenyl synthetase family protein [Burkholderiales bacterium]|nr:polyprenyl synthetase family protein [Burkholderiales bacterium]